MIEIIKYALIFLGKPIYFLLSGLIKFLIFLYNSPSLVIERLKKSKSKKQKKLKPKPVKIKPKKKEVSLKLQKLHFDIVYLRLVSRIKKTFSSLFKKGAGRKHRWHLWLFFPVTILLILAGLFYFLILKDLPSPNELGNLSPEISTKIYDRNGNLLYKIYKDENRTMTPLTQIPKNVILATLAAEDAEFYSHPGFSVRGIFRAIIRDIKTGSMQGGSTITQQLVKNTLLTPEKTIVRKIKELVLSIEVETLYTKDEILEMYLNEVSYGGTAYGIQEASKLYFGKDAKDLNLAEAALLAGLPKSPTTYSPFGSNPELAFERQGEVLRLMQVNGYITEEQKNSAKEEKLHFISNRTEIKAPHFVMYVRQLLVNKYGEDVVEKGGLEVTTSLDLPIQEATEQIVKTEVDNLKSLSVGNGAALVINPQTGEILAMVGSKDYFDIENDGNVNVLTSLRQPGSSIKVVNYAYALANGFTLSSIINDSPITFYSPGTTPYTPVNYDGQYKGGVTLRNALAESRNIPAVKVLASYGVTKMVEQGEKMGITTWNNVSDYGLSLTLGGGAVKALDLTKVYATLANLGETPELMPILEVKNYKGEILEKNSATTTQTIDERIAFLLTDILKDNNARAPEFGYNSSLVIKNHPEVAVKTGTSNNLRDNWTVGYNQNYLVLTWVGNNDNSPMSRVASGITGASPIWNKIMSTILDGEVSIDWKAPDGVSKISVCSATGTLPCDGCIIKQEWFLDENQPSKHCLPQNTNQNIESSDILETGASIQHTR